MSNHIKLWAIGMAKDEGDIIEHTMLHFAANDVDGIIIADNMSTDDTWEKMHAAEQKIKTLRPNIQVILLKDEIVEYTQSKKMTDLADRAKALGADWVIPFDIDEIWFSPNQTLKQACSDLSAEDYDIYKAFYTNHSVTEFDPSGISPFHSMIYKWDLPTNHKSCFRFRPSDSFVRISNGNHFVQHNGWDIGSRVKVAMDSYGLDKIVFGPQTIQIRHFQWRSLDHFMRKILNAYKACKALDSNADLYHGAAWQQHFGIYESDGIEGLEKFFFSNILVQNDLGSLIKDPAPLKDLI